MSGASLIWATYTNLSVGLNALPAAATAENNTAVGAGALRVNTTGNANTASGNEALFANTEGSYNTASGASALRSNTTKYYNTATGLLALESNTNGGYNTASGSNALYSNTTGSINTATGAGALFTNTQGSYNTADGTSALTSNTTGSNNIAVGFEAGQNVTGSNNIEIGNQGAANDSGTIRIGTPFVTGCTACQTSAYIAGIYGSSTGLANVPVVVDAKGNLGTVQSSRRFKQDIADMGNASDGLMQLRPVTFRYKQASDDGTKPLQYGLIAEEVAEVYPDLVVRSADGQLESVRYQLLNPMLLNELQKQRATIEAQKQQIRSLEERLASVEAALGTDAKATAGH